ncbi:MAG: hypothetical protein AVDCRST_MAG12-2802, partial [uncultured Rubrobacteraceae bacterium]
VARQLLGLRAGAGAGGEAPAATLRHTAEGDSQAGGGHPALQAVGAQYRGRAARQAGAGEA